MDIARYVLSALGDRNNVIDMVFALDRCPANGASSSLLRINSLNGALLKPPEKSPPTPLGEFPRLFAVARSPFSAVFATVCCAALSLSLFATGPHWMILAAHYCPFAIRSHFPHGLYAPRPDIRGLTGVMKWLVAFLRTKTAISVIQLHLAGIKFATTSLAKPRARH